MLSDRLTHLRPTLFHLTARANLKHIQRTRRLRPAVDIFAAAGMGHLSRTRRAESMVVDCGGQAIHVRDQALGAHRALVRRLTPPARTDSGVPGPRGPDTFRLAHDFDRTPSKVVEVVFRGPVSLEGVGYTAEEPGAFF